MLAPPVVAGWPLRRQAAAVSLKRLVHRAIGPSARALAATARRAPSLAKEKPMTTPVHFDSKIGEQFLRYARLVAARGYIHNTLGNMAIRAAHPDHPHGVAYTKHAEISLEEMGMENIVITDIPSSRLLYGSRMTSVGHNLNREILRLRPDIGAVIHVHDDATIAFFGSGAFREVKVLSLDMPFILGKPPYYVPAHVFFFTDTAPTENYTLSLHAALGRHPLEQR